MDEGGGREFLICFLIVIASFTFLTRTLSGPGLTWDEANFIPSSISYLDWFQTLIDGIKQGNLHHALSKDTITKHWYATAEHPPFAKLLSATTMLIFHRLAGLLFAARISVAFLFSLLILLVYKFTAKAYGRYAGYFSAISLFIMPRVFGHAHFASLDVCMSFTWFLTVFCFVKGIHNRKWAILTGIAYGLALATKLNAFFLPIPLLIWAHLYHRKEYLRNLIAMFFLSPLVFISIWPWLWPEPLTRIVNYLSFHSTEHASIPVYYLGTTYKEVIAPWSYPIVMSVVTLPPLVLILAILAVRWIGKDRFRDSAGTLILVNIIACIGVMILPQAQKYDGVRLFLPAFPFIACLAGMGLARILEKKSSLLPLGILLLLVGTLPLINIHPYYLSYYSILAGGVKGAKQLGFETTYWGDTCTDDALNYLNENAKQSAKIAFYPVGSNVVRLYKITGRLRQDIEAASPEEWETLDYLVLNCRQGFFDERLWEIYRKEKYEYATIFQDVPLTAIYKIHPHQSSN